MESLLSWQEEPKPERRKAPQQETESGLVWPSQQFEEVNPPARRIVKQEKTNVFWPSNDEPKNKHDSYDERPLPGSKYPPPKSAR